MRRILLAFFVAAAVTCAKPTVADEPAGFSARASLSVRANTQKGNMSLSGSAALERRGRLVRIDLLTLAVADPTKASPSNPIPPGGYSFVYDTATMNFTLWSPSRRLYYTGKGKPSAATPAPSPSASPTSEPSSVLAGLKDLRQFALSIALSPNKDAVDGHPTTSFDFKFARQVKNEDPLEVSGRATFADDLGGVPLLLTMKAITGAAGGFGADLRVALNDVKQTVPPQSDFEAPSDYVKASSIFDVIALPTRTGN
jgi:hypothetical protein